MSRDKKDSSVYRHVNIIISITICNLILLVRYFHHPELNEFWNTIQQIDAGLVVAGLMLWKDKEDKKE